MAGKPRQKTLRTNAGVELALGVCQDERRNGHGRVYAHPAHVQFDKRANGHQRNGDGHDGRGDGQRAAHGRLGAAAHGV